jgi:hypothetical protein
VTGWSEAAESFPRFRHSIPVHVGKAGHSRAEYRANPVGHGAASRQPLDGRGSDLADDLAEAIIVDVSDRSESFAFRFVSEPEGVRHTQGMEVIVRLTPNYLAWRRAYEEAYAYR